MGRYQYKRGKDGHLHATEFIPDAGEALLLLMYPMDGVGMKPKPMQDLRIKFMPQPELLNERLSGSKNLSEEQA